MVQIYLYEKRVVSIDQSAVCYISMDLSRRALQTNGKRFSNFKIIYRINYIKKIVVLCINACVKRKAFVLISTPSNIYHHYIVALMQ